MTGLVEDLYERDFYAWAHDQAAALRRLADARANVGLDIPNLVEEVEGLARSERNAVVQQLERLIKHLLKLELDQLLDRGWLPVNRHGLVDDPP